MSKKIRNFILLCSIALTTLGVSTNHAAGHDLPDSDFVVAGIPKISTANAIIQSLGEPTIKYRYGLGYGGLIFEITRGNYPEVKKKIITSRDAVTARGISVGDSIDDIYTKYGSPDTAYVNNQGYYVLFYGTYTPNTPHDLLKSGIEFITNYRYVKSIYICVR